MTETAAGQSGSAPLSGSVRVLCVRCSCWIIQMNSCFSVFPSDETWQAGFITVTTGASREIRPRLRGCGGRLDGWWMAEWRLPIELHPLLADLRSLIFHVSRVHVVFFLTERQRNTFPSGHDNRSICSYSIAGHLCEGNRSKFEEGKPQVSGLKKKKKKASLLMRR